MKNQEEQLLALKKIVEDMIEAHKPPKIFTDLNDFVDDKLRTGNTKFRFYIWDLPKSRQGELEDGCIDFIREAYIKEQEPLGLYLKDIIQYDYLLRRNGFTIAIRLYDDSPNSR